MGVVQTIYADREMRIPNTEYQVVMMTTVQMYLLFSDDVNSFWMLLMLIFVRKIDILLS